MNAEPRPPLIAVDIGNSMIKLGLFEAGATADRLPQPVEVIQSTSPNAMLTPLLERLPPDRHVWHLASVQRDAQQQLIDWVAEHRSEDDLRVLSCSDLPLAVEVDEPDRVGVDRLVAAVAANRLRPRDRGAIVIDTGTAVTVDAVSPEGVFLGGAILPGLSMTARALHQEADLLPQVHFAEDHDPPESLGKSTEGAIRSGLYWGLVGAVRELVQQHSETFDQPPVVLVTGGLGKHLLIHLGGGAHYVPHLVLGGIALAANHRADPS